MPPKAPPPEGSTRLRMLVAYDGTGFRGFAAQPGVATVAGALVSALERQLRCSVDITCAGRTDAGVHAWGQVVSFDAPAEIDLERVQRSLNRTLGPAIVIRDLAVAPEGFDARRWATGRTYRYSIRNHPLPDPFSARTAWHVKEPLDVSAMRLACDPLYGEHDFSSFCRRSPAEGSSLVRVVREASWVVLGDSMLRFEIAASAFCHQMVRSVVGLMIEVGTGRKHAGDVTAIIAARSRGAAGQLAPPHGLCLWEVDYPDGP